MDFISEFMASYDEVGGTLQTNDTINFLNAELDEERRKYQDLMGSYAECESKLSKAMAEIFPCQQQNDELRTENSALKEHLNSLSLKYDSIQKEVIQYKALAGATTEKLEEVKILRKESTKRKSLLDKTKLELREKCSEVRGMKNKVKHLEKFVEEMIAVKDKLTCLSTRQKHFLKVFATRKTEIEDSDLDWEDVNLPENEISIDAQDNLNGNLDLGVVSTSNHHYTDPMHITYNEDGFAYNSFITTNPENKSPAKQKTLAKPHVGNNFFLSQCLSDDLEPTLHDLDMANLKQQLCLRNEQYSPLSPLPPTPPPNNRRGQKRKLDESKMSSNPRVNSTDPVPQRSASNAASLSRPVPAIPHKVNLLHQESEGFEVQEQATPLAVAQTSQANHNVRFQDIVFKKNSTGSLELSLSIEDNKTQVMVDREKERLLVTIDMFGGRARSTCLGIASGSGARPLTNSVPVPCQTLEPPRKRPKQDPRLENLMKERRSMEDVTSHIDEEIVQIIRDEPPTFLPHERVMQDDNRLIEIADHGANSNLPNERKPIRIDKSSKNVRNLIRSEVQKTPEAYGVQVINVKTHKGSSEQRKQLSRKKSIKKCEEWEIKQTSAQNTSCTDNAQPPKEDLKLESVKMEHGMPNHKVLDPTVVGGKTLKERSEGPKRSPFKSPQHFADLETKQPPTENHLWKSPRKIKAEKMSKLENEPVIEKPQSPVKNNIVSSTPTSTNDNKMTITKDEKLESNVSATPVVEVFNIDSKEQCRKLRSFVDASKLVDTNEDKALKSSSHVDEFKVEKVNPEASPSNKSATPLISAENSKPGIIKGDSGKIVRKRGSRIIPIAKPKKQVTKKEPVKRRTRKTDNETSGCVSIITEVNEAESVTAPPKVKTEEMKECKEAEAKPLILENSSESSRQIKEVKVEEKIIVTKIQSPTQAHDSICLEKKSVDSKEIQLLSVNTNEEKPITCETLPRHVDVKGEEINAKASPSRVDEKSTDALMCVENLEPVITNEIIDENLPQKGKKAARGRKRVTPIAKLRKQVTKKTPIKQKADVADSPKQVTKRTSVKRKVGTNDNPKQVTKKAPAKRKVGTTGNTKCGNQINAAEILPIPVKIESIEGNDGSDNLKAETREILENISESFEQINDSDLTMKVEVKKDHIQSPVKVHNYVPGLVGISLEIKSEIVEEIHNKEVQLATSTSNEGASKIEDGWLNYGLFEGDGMLFIDDAARETASGETQKPSDQKKKPIQKKIIKGKKKKARFKKPHFQAAASINDKPKNKIVVALEAFDNLAFHDSHYKIFSHSLMSALLNPSNAPKVDEAVKPIVNYLVSSKRNPMITFMQKKESSKLMPLVESCIVTCLLEVDLKKRPHLDRMVKRILEKVPYYILRDELPMYGVAALCRVVTELAKRTTKRQVPFELCCELLKDKHKYFPFLVASIAGVWPEVLQVSKEATDSEKMLMFLVLFALKNKPKTLSETHWKQCNAVINHVIDIPQNITREELFNKFIVAVESLRKQRDSDQEEFEFGNALSMLAAIEGWQWAKEKILEPVVYPAVITLMQEKDPSAHKVLVSFFTLYADVARHCPDDNLGLDYFEKYTTEVYEKSPEQMSAHYDFHINLTYFWAQIICCLLNKTSPDRNMLQMFEHCIMFLTEHQKKLLIVNEIRLRTIKEDNIDLSLLEDAMAMANTGC